MRFEANAMSLDTPIEPEAFEIKLKASENSSY